MPARRAAEAAGITLEARLDSSIGLVAGDRNRLQQVFANLLRNAIKFTPKGGRVELDVERRGTEASVAVSDSGSGIRPELLANVFEHFTQDDDNRSGGGLGLGLAIVRHVVQRHGGIVEAESAGVGQGARFTVRLPLLASETATRAVG
jgi:signal transduction histidine kinase